jgi:hypothetical protein
MYPNPNQTDQDRPAIINPAYKPVIIPVVAFTLICGAVAVASGWVPWQESCDHAQRSIIAARPSGGYPLADWPKVLQRAMKACSAEDLQRLSRSN